MQENKTFNIIRIANKLAFLWDFNSYNSILTTGTNLIVNVYLFVVLILTYREVPHLGMEIIFAIGAFHKYYYHS
jgi:hypothetical protein